MGEVISALGPDPLSPGRGVAPAVKPMNDDSHPGPEGNLRLRV